MHLHALTPTGDDERDADIGARLDAALEIDLRWFFAGPLLAGLVADGGSFGSQLERAESYGYGAIPCRKCGGRWKQRRRSSDGERYFSEWKDGTGWFPSSKHFAKATSTYAGALKVYRDRMAREHRLVLIGKGGDIATNRAAAEIFALSSNGRRMVTERELAELFPDLPPELCRICDRCRGIGVIPRRSHKAVEVTARPMGSSVGKAGRHPDTMTAIAWDQLLRHGRIERVLERVALARPLHRIALAAYYGPVDGRRVVPGVERKPAGGIEALWPLGPTARDWLDGQPRRTLEEETEALRVRLEATKAPAPPSQEAPARASLADWRRAVVREAWALYGAACANATEAASATGWRASEAA